MELYGNETYVDVDLLIPAKHDNSLATLDEFYYKIKDCQKCSLANSRTNFVFGCGNPNAKLMCIGEAPGYEEDKQGEPFVGPAGELLNKILDAIGFRREEVYIANVIKCRPPNNRDPEVNEIVSCFGYLQKQIELIKPALILALGKIAAQSLLGTDNSLAKLRTSANNFSGIPVVVTYHPAALLRNQQWKHAAWEDVKKLRRMYDKIVGDKPEIMLK